MSPRQKCKFISNPTKSFASYRNSKQKLKIWNKWLIVDLITNSKIRIRSGKVNLVKELIIVNSSVFTVSQPLIYWNWQIVVKKIENRAIFAIENSVKLRGHFIARMKTLSRILSMYFFILKNQSVLMRNWKWTTIRNSKVARKVFDHIHI